MMRVLAVSILMLALSGCAAMERPSEQAWMVAHSLDVAQTMTYRDDPCLEERDPFTRTMIGREPTEKAALAWGIVGAIAHVAITQFLIDHGHDKAASAWGWVTFAQKGRLLVRGHSMGVRIGGTNKMECMR